MQIRVRVHAQALRVTAAGHMTESAARELLAQIRLELAPKPRDVILDLSAVETIAAGALPYLFRIQQEAGSRSGRLVLSGRSTPVQRLLEKTHVIQALEHGDAVALAARD